MGARFTKGHTLGEFGRAMFACACLAGVGATGIALGGASARAMGLVAQSPMVNQIMAGSGIAFALRFDEPIDHRRSTLGLVTPRGVMRLRARLDAEPNTLYGTLGRLEPGEYTLRWRAQAAHGAQVLMGTIPFRVAP